MKKKFPVIFFISLFLLSTFLCTPQKCIEFIQKIRLTDKILIVGIGDAVTAINTKSGIVVIDAGQSPTLTEQYKKIIEQEFGQNNFTYLINTHSHNDHTGGNQVFSDTKIIGHTNCAVEMYNYWKDTEGIKKRLQNLIDKFDKKLESTDIDSFERGEIQANKCRYITVLEDIKTKLKVTPPNITFNDTMYLDMGDMTLDLIYFGKAHTTSDIVIHIPEEKILLIGDLFVKGGNSTFKIHNRKDTEYGYHVLNSLIKKNNIETIITGHGDILTRNDLLAFYGNIEHELNSFPK